MGRRNVWRFSLRTALVVVTVAAVFVAVKANRARYQRDAIARVVELGGSVSFQYERDEEGESIANPVPPEQTWLRTALGPEFFDTVVGVYLRKTDVDDNDLALLGKLRDPRVLSLDRTSIGDEGVAHLRGLHQLRALDLSHTHVTDDTLKIVAKLERLRGLQLRGNQITDTGAALLASSASLEWVDLTGTGVTKAGVAQLLDSGRKVYCVLEPHVTAMDADGQPTSVVRAGEVLVLSGSMRNPTGSVPRGPLLFEVAYLHDDDGQVIIQSGFTTTQEVGPDIQSIHATIQIPAQFRSGRGLIILRSLGVTACEVPVEIKAAVETPPE